MQGVREAKACARKVTKDKHFVICLFMLKQKNEFAEYARVSHFVILLNPAYSLTSLRSGVWERQQVTKCAHCLFCKLALVRACLFLSWPPKKR